MTQMISKVNILLSSFNGRLGLVQAGVDNGSNGLDDGH
jgi:hypothetical protein